MSARLRVGIAGELTSLGATTGHGRTWHHLLAHLAPSVELVVAPSRAQARTVAVWLVDGHAAPPPVEAPIVSMVHDVRWTEPEHRPNVPITFLAITIPETAAAIAASTLVVTPSRSTREAVCAGYALPAERVVSVPLGVDAAVFRPGRPAPVALTAPYVLFVGTVEPRKRVDLVRDAVNGLARRGLPHQLVLRAGAAQSLDSRRLLAEAAAPLPAAGRVHLLPRLDDAGLAGAMAAATALTLPSECEGFGLPVLEAMACGTPVVVSDRAALPEVVGDAGLVVVPEAEAVEDALRRIATDAAFATDLGTRARARAETMSWSATADGYLRALEAAADTRAVSSALPPRAPAPWVPVLHVESCPVCGSSLAGADPIASRRARLVRCPSCHAVVARDVLPPGAQARPDGGPRSLPAAWPGVALEPDEDDTYRRRVASEQLALLARARRPGDLAVVGPDADLVATAALARDWNVVVDDGPVDALVAAHVVNRVVDATTTLRDLARRVRPGGLILLEVPNWRSAVRRRGVDAWHHLRPLEQVTAFDRASVRTLLQRAGLEALVVATRTRPLDDLARATHALPPLRRVLRGVLGPLPWPLASPVVRAISAAYDATGLGDVIVALAHVPGDGFA